MAPRITVVTPSFNQGRFIARTIESVLAQGYPDVEHIVVDGLSTDETPGVLARYPHLRVLREPDRGQAEAINKGFRLATGDVFCFLNSDDTLMPGALQRVAREIDPARGRHVVLGRCRHIDEDDRVLHIEHPCGFLHHRRVLEIWKEHCVPQPSTFWTAEVWRRCGPLNEHEPVVLDYDLFCRFSRHYHFHFVDQVLASYRLHSASKTCTRDFDTVYREALRVSRNYWGPPTRPLFWQMWGSFALDQARRALWRLRRKHWAARLVDDYQRARADGHGMLALACLSGAAMLAPDLTFGRLWQAKVTPLLRRCGLQAEGEAQWRLGRVRPLTLAWRGYTDVHFGNFLGPTYVARVRVGRGHRALHLSVAGVMDPMPWPLDVDVYLAGRPVYQCRAARHVALDVELPLADVPPGEHELKVVSSAFVVPHDYLGNGDFRPLALKLNRLRLVGDVCLDLPRVVRRAA